MCNASVNSLSVSTIVPGGRFPASKKTVDRQFDAEPTTCSHQHKVRTVPIQVLLVLSEESNMVALADRNVLVGKQTETGIRAQDKMKKGKKGGKDNALTVILTLLPERTS